MTEKDIVVKAAQTIKAFCQKTSCYDCPFSRTEDGKSVRICLLMDRYPLDWEVGSDKG